VPGGPAPRIAEVPRRLSPARLGQIVQAIASRPAYWQPVVRFTADHRWYYRVDMTDCDLGDTRLGDTGLADWAASYEVWLLSWLPGQGTGFHDHGDAAGAFAVADGELLETTAKAGSARTRGRRLAAGAVRSFGSAHLHDVRNEGARPAVSVHAYSPPLSAMRRYEMTRAGLVLSGTETAEQGW